LNRIISGKLDQGLPEKSLTLLVGQEHTFKSSLMVNTAKQALLEGFKPVIIDTEGGISGDFAARWGLDLDKVLYIYSPWAEEVKGALAQLKESQEEKFCIILDSIGGIDKLKSYGDALGGEYKQDMGGNARIIKSTLKLLVNIIKSQNSIGVVSSHFYSSSGSVPMPDSVVGGKSVLLLPDIILYLKKVGKAANAKIAEDKRVLVMSIKNRFYPAEKVGYVDIDYVNGINVFSGMMEIALEAGIIVQGGSWFSYKGENVAQGLTKATQVVLADPVLKKSILDEINEYLQTTGFSSAVDEKISKDIKLMAESITS
jgi:recombination protein RecA